jgi:catechol 2,3-dioxygenase-like lactoylglutathione lyase family enzyme
VLLGSINHVSITVSDLPRAMAFLRPILEFMGYVPEGKGDGVGVPVVVSVNPTNGIAFNVWQAKPELRERTFEIYSPGLHHVAFNAASKQQVDRLHQLVVSLGGEILDPPGEYPYALGGYYAFYFCGPDRIKFEFVFMNELDALYRRRGLLEER